MKPPPASHGTTSESAVRSRSEKIGPKTAGPRIAPAVRKARAAGIVVVAVDVGAEGGVSATVMSDNLQAGRLVAETAGRLHR